MEQISPINSDLSSLIGSLLAKEHGNSHRQTLVLAGESDWGWSTAQIAITQGDFSRITCLSSQAPVVQCEVIDAGRVNGLLGQERDAVIIDAHSGFDPDAFGIVSGIICGGGLLILLCPPLSEWSQVADLASERIAISPYSYKDISGRFIRRLVGILMASPGVVIVDQEQIQQGNMSSVQKLIPITSIKDNYHHDLFRTQDQQKAVDAIEHVFNGHRRRPVVLVSDRGRGKSAALGIAAAQILQTVNKENRCINILVTAPQRSSVRSLFYHAHCLLQDVNTAESDIRWQGSTIRYLAPDELCLSNEPADLLLVDEAAAIPAAMLEKLLNQYSRIVFATTIHGYEGTGRGFAIRFRQTLDKETPGWHEVHLHKPIRWAENDPLENMVFRALLLDAECADDDSVLGADADNVVIECLDRDELVNDEGVLSQIFGLLVVAHYQTTPNDLRNLLDGPGISVYVMRYNDSVVAAALVSAEGNFSSELADAIYAGQRRPRGHLIPQSLLVHAGIRQAGQLQCARIMRITVHPAMQGKGLGSKLVQHIRREANQHEFDLMGVSFGATPELLRFWRALDMMPVRVGFRRDHASGEYSAMMLIPLNKEGEEVYRLARNRMCQDFPHWLSDALRELDWRVAAELLHGCDVELPGSIIKNDETVCALFAKGARSYDDCSASLWRMSAIVLTDPDSELSRNDCMVLITRVLQKRSWAQVASLVGLKGRAEVLSALRNAVSHFQKSSG